MSNEILRRIDSSIIQSTQEQPISVEEGRTIWTNILKFFRLRYHEGYLSQTEEVLNKITLLLSDSFPSIGVEAHHMFTEIIQHPENQRVIIQKVYPALRINFFEAPSNAEEDVFRSLKSIESVDSLSPQDKEKIVSYFKT